MTAFADSSALVKLYANEAHASEVRKRDLFVVASVARVEVPAALWRKVRMGELAEGDAAVLTRVFETDWNDVGGLFVIVALVPRVLEDAARLVATHGLRAYDGVQLASALAARASDPQIDEFATYDKGLLAAAAAEGFAAAA